MEKVYLHKKTARVIVPEFIPIGLALEAAIDAGSDAVAVLDTIALLKMAGDSTNQKERVEYALQSLMTFSGIFIGKILADGILKICDESDFAHIIIQTIPSIQQAFSNIIWE